MSHPAWVCGLKLMTAWEFGSVLEVTPCVGVWIETIMGNILSRIQESHPAWVCGLKLHMGKFAYRANVSHPAWVCGLKPR